MTSFYLCCNHAFGLRSVFLLRTRPRQYNSSVDIKAPKNKNQVVIAVRLKMATNKCILRFLLAVVLIIPGESAPKKSKRGDQVPHTVYDQKQTGDYNIQLHLKDFQIIAVLGDDAANFGDYDYTYDYSDFTVKPVTQKPSESLIPSSPTSITSLSTPKPTTTPSISKPIYQPYPILHPSTEKPFRPEDKPTKLEEKPQKPEEKPFILEEKPTKNEENPSSTEKLTINEKPLINNETLSNDTKFIQSNSTATNAYTTQKASKFDDLNSPGKIKVQIIETPVRMGIVPGEDISDQNETLPQGEILHLKRCAQGFTKDKRGRCRRVRRPGSIQPQLSYGFSRLASNLASRLRQTSEETSASSSESKED